MQVFSKIQVCYIIKHLGFNQACSAYDQSLRSKSVLQEQEQQMFKRYSTEERVNAVVASGSPCRLVVPAGCLGRAMRPIFDGRGYVVVSYMLVAFL